MQEHVLEPGQGKTVHLGAVDMRLLAARQQTAGAFAAAEFRGSEGRWTVPHVHRHLEESFYVLEGSFAFTCGEREIEAERGTFLLVPRCTRHVFAAGPGGGALLVLWVPGGLEEMFLQLGRLSADSLTDGDVRAELGRHFDSVPV